MTLLSCSVRFSAWLMAGVLAVGCASPSPYGYAAKTGPLAVPPGDTSPQPAPYSEATPPPTVTELALALAMPYASAWLQVGSALERGNFTVEDRDRARGVYVIRYADPMDQGATEQGFWSQMFHDKKEETAQLYRIGLRAVTPRQTRVAIVDDQGRTDTSRPAAQIMALLAGQFH